MVVILGILIGAMFVGGIWACVYFNQEIVDLRAEMRTKVDIDMKKYRIDYDKGIKEWRDLYYKVKDDHDKMLKENCRLWDIIINNGLDVPTVEDKEDDD